MMKPKRRGLYTVDWADAKDERAFYDGENWYRFASAATPARITRSWEGGSPRPIDEWRDLALDPGWYHVEGPHPAMFWDGHGWHELVASPGAAYRPVRAAHPPGGEPG